MQLFIIVIVTHFIALLSPGPDFFLILTSLFRNGPHAARAVCLGIVLGNVAVIGLILSALFFLGKLDDEILKLVKWGCIAYLSYLSYRCFIFAQQAKLIGDYHLEHQNKPTFAWMKYVLLGVQSSLLNPKNILFYSSIIMAIYQHYNVVQLTLTCLWMVSVVLIWNLFLVRLMTQNIAMHWFKTKIKYIYYLSSFCFGLFAAALLLN